MLAKSKEKIIKSKNRVRDQGEVFTQEREVKNILALTQATDNIYWKFLEPACGNGNFLVEIVRQRLNRIKQTPNYKPDDKLEYAIIKMLSTIYGVDIAKDNVEECKNRIMHEVFSNTPKRSSSAFLLMVKIILDTNIQIGDMLNGKDKVFFIDYNITPVEYMSRCKIKRSVYALTSMENDNTQPLEEFEFTKPIDVKPVDLTRYYPELVSENCTQDGQMALFNMEVKNV